MKRMFIWIGVIVAVGVIVVIAARYTCNTKSSQPCANTLRMIESAKEQWALSRKSSPGSTVAVTDILEYMKAAPTCKVAGAEYTIGNIGEEPRCSVHGTPSDYKPDRY